MLTTTCGSQCKALTDVLRPMGPYQLAACPNCLDAVLVDYTGEEPEFRELDGIDRVSDLAPAGSVMSGVFGILDEVILSLPVLPHVTQRLLSMIHDPIISMTDLANVINEDATISVKVLRVSNSALYASSHEIKDLHVACARLGLRMVANVVNAAANSNLYRGSQEFRNLMNRLWKHAVTTAHCADKIAAALPGEEHRSAFVAGLVHDIGKLVLIDALTSKYKGNVGRLKDSPDLIVKVLDRFHPIVGLHVVQYWKMPPEFAFTTFYSPRPHLTLVDHWRNLGHVTCLASAMADAYGNSVEARDAAAVPLPSTLGEHPSAAALGLDGPTLAEIQQKALDELEMVLEVFGAP